MYKTAALACLFAAFASAASAAPLTEEMQKEIRNSVTKGTMLALQGHSRANYKEFAARARESCARAAEIAAGADPDPYYQGEISRCFGDAAAAEGDAAACDHWTRARGYYLDPKAAGPTDSSAETRARWATTSLTERCGETF